MEDLFERIAACVEFGKINQVSPYPPAMKGQPGAEELTVQALEENVSPSDILTKGLILGMERIGLKFKENKVFVPQVLMSAKAMGTAMKHLKPFFNDGTVQRKGQFIIGTVEGDLHDIGKNLVVMMLKGAGFEICDLGVDVEPSAYIDKAEEIGADIICMSALLTTTMPKMQDCIDLLNERGLRDKYIVMIGGAPVNDSFCEQIGADYYTPDAASCAEVAKKVVLEKKQD